MLVFHLKRKLTSLSGQNFLKFLILVNSTYEKFLGSFASIFFALISFYRKTNIQVYIWISKALEEMDSPLVTTPMSTTVNKVREESNITLALVEDISVMELDKTTELVRGHRLVEVPGKDDPAIASIP